MWPAREMKNRAGVPRACEGSPEGGNDFFCHMVQNSQMKTDSLAPEF